MKVTVIILLALICCSCKTYNVYLINTKPMPVFSAPVKAPVNRFTAQFGEADSLFRIASSDAMKKAYEKTKHLIPR